jgi:hypothetical protein
LPVISATIFGARRDTASGETAHRRQNGMAIVDGVFRVFHKWAAEHSPNSSSARLAASHSVHLPRRA